MVNRFKALLGMAVVAVALAAALLAGAASATAETGSGSDSGGTESSASAQQSGRTTNEPTSKSDATTTSGAATTGVTGPDSERPGSGADQKPAENNGSTGNVGGTGASSSADNPPGKDAQHGGDASGQIPVNSPPASSREGASGSALDPPAELRTAQTTTENSARPPTKTPKTRTDEQNSGRPDTAGPVAAAPDQPAMPSTQSATTTTPSESQPEPQPASSATDELGSSTAEVTEGSVTKFSAAAVTTAAMSAASTVAPNDQAPAPRAPTLIDVVGSIVLNLVMGLVQAFDGPPVLPPGSNVIVRSSTLTIPVAGGRTVEADWYFPTDAEPPTRLVYLQHGLFATGPMYSYTAATLAEQTHSIVVAPSITSNWFDADAAWLGGTPMQRAVADLFVGNREALTASASAAAGYDVTLPTRFVLAGHSLGGTLVSGAAGYMVDNGAVRDLAGVLLLDSVDLNDAVPTALQKLTGVNNRPVLNISSERYFWNMNGRVSDELEATRPGRFNGVMLVGGRHIDALQGGNPLIQTSEYLVAGFSQPQNIEAVRTLAVGWVNDMFAGTHDGIYGTPQETIQIPTDAGTATAVALPFTTEQVSLIDYVLNALFDFAGRNFFVYEPLAGQAPTVPTAIAA